MTLENRTAVISGATGELGLVLSRQLAAYKVNLALLGRDTEKLAGMKRSLNLPEDRVLARTVDLLDLEATRAAAGSVAARFGRTDILIHIVGGSLGGKTLVETPPVDLQTMLNQHVWTSFNAVQAFVPYITLNGWGRVVMITSASATQPRAKRGVYAVAKAGQEALMLALAQEVVGTGVTANMLLARQIDVKREKVNAPSPENAAWTTPEEMSAVILYLLSEASGTINGARIPVHSGYN
jgi:NAD(P)-dependent dehydrogenase (short-subunit alcohol dehydrogenase family)